MAAPRGSGRLFGRFAKRSGIAEFARGFGDIGTLAPQIVRKRAPKIGIGDVVRGESSLRQISPRDLVLPLRAGLNRLQATADRKVDGLIIADFEMQERMMFDRTPVAAEQGVGADEVDGACNPAPLAPGHHQQYVLGHALADERKKLAIEIGPAPFPRAGVHVEVEEGIPCLFGDLGASQRLDGDAARQRITPLAPDRLEVTRIQRGEKILKTAKTLIVPVKLLIVTLQESAFGEELPL